MSNETTSAAEATSSEEPRSAIAGIGAKTEPKDILNGLIHDLNNLILIAISAVYCFDCFSLLYLLRFFSQAQSAHAGVRVVLTANIVCILTHLFHTIPQPGPREFWNHGGLLVDFVGETPASRGKLLLFDALILGMQVLYLAMVYKVTALDGSDKAKTTAPMQDLDAEEAGISRTDPPTIIETHEGIEMQNLLPRGSENQAQAEPGLQPHVDNTILLRRADFNEVFLHRSRNTETSDTRVQQLLERLDVIRNRRIAQQTAAV